MLLILTIRTPIYTTKCAVFHLDGSLGFRVIGSPNG